MKYLSLFSGIGGFELGIQQAYETKNCWMGGNEQSSNTVSGGQEEVNGTGVGNKQAERLRNGLNKPETTCVGFSEIDKYAIQTYKKHFPEHENFGDITKINEEELPDFDLLCGGFPCQSFSIAGKRGGFSDTRGTMFFHIARITRAKRPRLLFLENVKGLLSHDQGKTFRTIIATLDELGYDCQWQVLNSKNFGVPQNRERVFIIGHLRGTPRPEVFPFCGTDEKTHEINELTGARKQGNRLYGTDGIAPSVQSAFGMGGTNTPNILQLNNPTHSNNRVYGEEGLSPTLNTAQGGNRQPKIVIPVLTPDRPEKRQNGRRFKENGDPSFTLTAQDKHGISDGMRIRRLTPTECERLQGFPDGWTEGVSDTQRYKVLGNAVTTNVIKAITTRLLR